MAVRIIRNDVCTTQAARQMVELVLSKKPVLDCSRAGKLIQGKDASFKLIKADRNVIMEVRVLQFPVPLIMKYPNGSDSQPRKAITWEAGQWDAVCAATSFSGTGVAPALIAFDEETVSLFLERLSARTAYQTMALSPLITLSGSAVRQTLSRFGKLGKLLATLHSHSATQPSPLSYGLETKLAGVIGKLGQDKALDEGWKVFRQFFQGPCQTTWIHGNLRTDNVLFTHNDVALIDLENAGAGDPMEDIGRLIAYVIMFRRLSIFPKRFWEAMVEQIVHGYGAGAVTAPQRLLTCVLGEMLVVYGRDYVSKELSWIHHHFKKVLERSIWRLLAVFDIGAEHILERPSLLVV